MRKALGPLVALVLLTPGCFYPASKGKAMEERVDKLEADDKEQFAAIEKQKEDLQRQLPAMTNSIAELQARLDKLEHASRTSDADVGVQMEAVREDLARLRGQVEEYQHRLDVLDQGLKQVQTDTEQKLTALKGPEAMKKAEETKKAAALQRPTDKNAFLKLADEQAAAGSSEVATTLYNEFLQKWGKDPLAANAHFALGKLQEDGGHYREALVEFEDVLKKFPRSDKAAPALLHSSECFDKLKMNAEAKLALEALAKDYPNTQEGRQAKERLKKAAAAPKGKKGK